MSISSRKSEKHPSSTSSCSQLHPVPRPDISLDTLVSHLIASKISLASIRTVWRAKEIVISARSALEECVVLFTRTNFLRKNISEQIATLQKIRSGIDALYDESEKDFKDVIHNMDLANKRLESTMGILRSTMVEATFRPEDEEARSLLDFLDEQGVESMRDSLKDSIREAEEAKTEFNSSMRSFDDDIRTLNVASKDLIGSQLIMEPTLGVPRHLQTLESHAQEMASLLESLVRHFDLCVIAIRNTEGGTAAVKKAASSQLAGVDAVSISGVMSTENVLDGEQISEEEMQEILDVLEKDSAQVEEVVMELKVLLADMEIKYGIVQESVTLLEKLYEESVKAFQTLDLVGLRLRGYIHSSHDFCLRWDDIKVNIQSQLRDLDSIRLFYENYYSSYDGLILEVQRRKLCEDRMHAILTKAADQLQRIYEDDMHKREEFRADVGEYLPVDLWPGVGDATPRWNFIRIDGKNTVPTIGSAVVEAAEMRVRARENAKLTR
ncbi:kinase activator (Atg17) [Blumeria hordei DH14]|uniref:Autophagy-related protein 17 n=1 Tax=Blumeria graminis f. sp. hordei (strain DH14) TaxID=546991 RepID=N1JL04_BLUG1|nr:kinase activator (Atg17) [Blumeria hordei DH14]